MKLFLKYILVFGIIFFTLEKGLYYFIHNAPNKEYDKRLQLILDGEMEKDLVIIGSSRGANNISAKQLEDQTGLSTYNLSYRGSNVTFHEFILEALLLHNKKPKKVLLVIDNGHQFLIENSLKFRYDRLSPLKNYSWINDKLIKSNKKSYISKFLYSLKIDRKDFSLKPKIVYPINIMTSHGSKLLKARSTDTLAFFKKPKGYDITKENPDYLKSFKSMQKTCKTHNIDLYFVFTPAYQEFDTDFLKRFKKLINTEEHLIVYDTICDDYKNNLFFRDHTHMFSIGAEIFTSEISVFFNSKTKK
ncbi:hypothetical protein ACFQ5N_10465 [Lutibacter holmesii]|uniref:DUF1574 domain-containing protein n=1 Tax=Lutibacter holmesii TaxID=1137985 RepID=A0ABW3WPR2_9FLAO